MDTVRSDLDAASEIESVDALLGELDLSDVESDASLMSAIEGDVLVEKPLSPSEVDAITVAIATAESYEDQSVTTTEVEAPAADTETDAVTKTKRVKKAKVASEPRPKSLDELPDAVFAIDPTVAIAKADVIALRPSQKKVAEKFDNLFMSIAAGKKPSVYVMACFAVLDSKKTVTQGDLVGALQLVASKKGDGYTIGTARSQAGQIMHLFNAVGIAARAGQTLTMNINSAIAEKLRAMGA